MKRFLFPGALATVALLLATTVLTAQAAPPASNSTTSANVDPAHAALIQGQTQTIPANSSLWYRFDYLGDAAPGQRDTVTIIMPNGTDSGLDFKVWTPGQMSDWWELTPVGQGTSQNLRSSNDTPADYGQVLSSDLSWKGSFGETGTFYVQVENKADAPVTFQLVQRTTHNPRY